MECCLISSNYPSEDEYPFTLDPYQNNNSEDIVVSSIKSI